MTQERYKWGNKPGKHLAKMLYATRNEETREKKEIRNRNIQEYLMANLPKIQEEQLIKLEEPITQDEIKIALKDTPIG